MDGARCLVGAQQPLALRETTMRFLVSRCYDVVTPESAKDGDIADSGFVFENQEMDFREVLRELESCARLSAGPIRSPEDCANVWAYSEPDEDYQTGAERSESVHIKNRFGGNVAPQVLYRIYRTAGLIAR
jgi:hypothetical protein